MGRSVTPELQQKGQENRVNEEKLSYVLLVLIHYI